MNELHTFLEHKAYQLRRWSVIMSVIAQSGHPTSCLSAADIVAVLFFYVMRFDPDNAQNPCNDRFILSKGHASALLYAVWNQLGKISDHELRTYRQFGSALEGHPTRRCPYVQAATGSLGIGLSIGVGHGLNAGRDGYPYLTYVLMGDAELAEGSIWEAAEVAAHYKLANLIGIVDCNRLGQTGQTMLGTHAERYAQRFEAFGWSSYIVDGHDISSLINTFDRVRIDAQDRPTIIIANTKKGHGLSVEDQNGYHGKVLEQEASLRQLAQKFPTMDHYEGSYQWVPQLPKSFSKHALTIKRTSAPHYTVGDCIATRKAYGAALAALGSVYPGIVALDGDVKNSTFAELFEKDFPERFVECFVAEQNMISMAVGLDQCGKLPFVSTFGAFMTRAHDQIRMAAIGQSAIKLVGSHAGVSIGQDGPSQMALEDIAMMRSIPESCILYPADAVSTTKLVEQMIHYTDGISYLRTTREATPVIYKADEQFPIGGCKVLRRSESDSVCVVAAGITVFEALKAYEQLQKDGISIAVIDLYSIKPLDIATIQLIGQTSRNRIITVEDHYTEGGIGQSVAAALSDTAIAIEILAITQLPRSGSPEHLRSVYQIDAEAIIESVRRAY